MIVDRIDLFEALAQHEIRVARSAYADSAADALAFAARRTAPDARLVPIRLQAAFPGVALKSTPAFSESPYTDPQSIEDAYERLAGKTAAADGRVLVQVATEPGTDIGIECRIDAALGKVIAIHGAAHGAPQLLPLGSAGAAALAGSIQGRNHHLARAHVQRMLEHLLIRVAGFYEESGMDRLEIDPVRLHGNGYTVLDAIAVSQHALRVKHIEAGERDKKGHYHPSGRQ